MVYTIKPLSKNSWEIANFSDYAEPDAVYQVSLNKDHYYCNCPGYRRQKTIGKHKHIRLLQFWKNQLEQPEGCSLWFEGVDDEDIEYRIFIPPNEALKKILIC